MYQVKLFTTHKDTELLELLTNRWLRKNPNITIDRFIQTDNDGGKQSIVILYQEFETDFKI
jgi:hypothetical protein